MSEASREIVPRGSWVKLHIVALKPEERAPQVPEDTKCVPLEMWVKGTLQEDTPLGEEGTVVTRTGRLVSGTVAELNPCYTHSFGRFVPELNSVGDQARSILFGEVAANE